jgi:hypothetical protein
MGSGMTDLGLRRSLGQLKGMGRLGPNPALSKGGGGGIDFNQPFLQDDSGNFVTDALGNPIGAAPQNWAWLLEDGFFLLREDGSLFLREVEAA